MSVDATFRVWLDINGDGVAGPPGGNQITNGDFASGETGWSFDGNIMHSVSGGKLLAYRNGGSNAAFYQDFSYPATGGDTFEVSFKVANTSGTEKTFTVFARADDTFTGAGLDTIVIPASTSEYTETLTLTAAGAWATTRLEFNIATDDNDAELTFDDISITVTDCIDNITDEVRNGSAILGLTEPEARIAEVGEMSIIVDNSNRQFSPNNSSSPYYGKLTPKRALVIAAIVSSVTITLWTGMLSELNPHPGRFGDQLADLIGHTRMRDYQDNQDITIPLQQDKRADELLPLIDANTYKSGAASGTVVWDGVVTDGDTITIGDVTYTFKDTLTGTANQIKINAQRYAYWVAPDYQNYADDTLESLAAAINGDDSNSNAYYSTGTVAHGAVVARVDRPAIGWPSGQTGGHDLQNSATNKEYLAAYLNFPQEDFFTEISEVRLWLKKSGSPTGTLTLSIRYSTGSASVKDGPLIAATATATVNEADLSTSYGWVTFTFATPFSVDSTIEAVARLETDRAAHASNYVTWGYDDSAPYTLRTDAYYFSGSTWTGSPIAAFLLWIPATLTLEAVAHGTQGNIALSTTSAALTVSGATLTGGAQPTAFTPSYDTGKQTFEYAADTWQSGINAMTAIDEIARAEYGYFAIGRDGAPVFKNMTYFFEALAQTQIAIDNTMAGMTPRYSLDRVQNQIAIDYRTRTQASGVRIGSAPTFRLRPRPSFAERGSPRWAAYKARPTADQRHYTTFTVDARDEASGNPVGVVSVDVPVAGVNYTVNTEKDGSGVDKTSTLPPRWSWAIKGAAVDVSARNGSKQRLWIRDFYLDGTVLRYDEPQVFIHQDDTSITAYGVRPGSYEIPLPTGDAFAQGLGDYLLQTRKDPRMMVDTVSFDVVEYAAASHLFTIDLFDVLAVEEYQTVFDRPVMVTGIEYAFDAETVTNVLFHVRQIDADYFILDNATYGVLDTNVLSL